MSENCARGCDGCQTEECNDRESDSLLEQPNAQSHIKRVIGVVSGKGGVGKSSICALAAVSSRRMGWNTAIMDADVTGPSIPRMFGITEQVFGTDQGIIPAVSKTGIQLISTNLVLEQIGRAHV